MKHVPLCLQLCWLGSAIIPWSTELNQANSASFSPVSYKWQDQVNLSLLCSSLCLQIWINQTEEWQWARGGIQCLAHPLPWLWRKPDSHGGVQGKYQKNAAHPCNSPSLLRAHQGKKNLWPSPEQLMSATDSYTILREIEGIQPLAKGHNEKVDLGKKPNPPAPCCWCASPCTFFLWSKTPGRQVLAPPSPWEYRRRIKE